MDTELTLIVAFSGAVVAFALSVVALRQERRSVAHWALAGGMLLLALESALCGAFADAVLVQEIVWYQVVRLFVFSLLPSIWLIFSLTYARGNYRGNLLRWRYPLVLALILPVVIVLSCRQSLIASVTRTEQGSLLIGVGYGAYALSIIFLLSAVLILMNLERTYRAAVGTMRWRIKFLILSLGVLFGVRAYTSSQVILTGTTSLTLQTINCAALLVACLLMVRSLSRSGHFEVSVYPSQAVLHNSLTMMVAGVYLFAVGVLTKVVGHFGWGKSLMWQAFLVLIALVILTILLLSDKAHLYTRRFVSRHFQRPLYDYRTVWRVFTAGTTRQVEQKDLCVTIGRLTSELFQALSVTVWVVDERKHNFNFVASTAISEAKAKQIRLDDADARMVLEALRARGDPVDLDASKEVWAAVLRRLQPDEFNNGGDRICVPLMASEELLGILILGDRVGGVPYSMQDFDLLKSVGEQVAASLLNIQLSQKLSQAKQLEAFQAMSAFFVHDLKNTASTLSLMLQNLPVHFDKPEFREDALRAIGATVNHIKDVISSLNSLRQDLTIKPAETDLNDLVARCLICLEGIPKLELLKNLRSMEKIFVDPAQLQTVITNLALNAKDAIGNGGQIRVETVRRDGWVELSVADNGCGMTPEFLQQSLFRPFQTTKKRGIGIGMFQCKMIVEAHGGRIEVQSEVGKGTEFKVLLPAKR